MYNVVITGPKNVQESVIKELHSLKVLHIVEHLKSDLADIGTPLENATSLSELLVKTRSLIAALNIKKEENKSELKQGLIEIESTLKKLNSDANKNLEELKKLQENISKNESVRQELDNLKDIHIPLENFTSYKSLSYFTGFVNDKNKVVSIMVDVSLTTKNFMLFDSIVKNKSFIVLFVDVKSRENTNIILQKSGFFPVNFLNISNLKGMASNNLKKLVKEYLNLVNNKEEIKKKIEKLGQDYKPFLISAENFLSILLEKAEVPLRFASTPSSFMVKGWIPHESLQKSIDRINKAGSGKIFIHFELAKKKDKVPVKLKNPTPIKPFEFFLGLYSMPSYNEIDPTFFVFLTFPIFFGIMLGDVGYGLASLILFWLLKKKMPKAKNFFNVLMLSSFVSILFGFLFGEFFGFEFIRPIISREHDMFTLMFIAVGIGVVHVNIGLIIGFINELKSHGLMKAIYEKISWIILQIGVALLALSYLSYISISPLIGAGFSVLSILMLLKGEGVKGIMELPSIFTNILSYARLMAIGLSSVVLAVIINDSSKELFHKGGVLVFVGVLILIIGHIINIMLGLLGSFLHSLRLHYVEFFTKFFHGGAEKYKPFGAKEE